MYINVYQKIAVRTIIGDYLHHLLPPSAEWLLCLLLSFLFSSFLWYDLSFLAICCGGLMAKDSSSSPLRKNIQNQQKLHKKICQIWLNPHWSTICPNYRNGSFWTFKHSDTDLSSVESSLAYGELCIVISILWSCSSPSSGVSRLDSRSSVYPQTIKTNTSFYASTIKSTAVHSLFIVI